MTTSTTSAALDSNNQIASNQLGVSSDIMSTTLSQSSTTQQQALAQGAHQSRSSDVTTSNSVINSNTAAAAPSQSGDQQWLDSSISSWDKQIGSQPNTPRLDHSNNPVSNSQFASWNAQSFPSFSSNAPVTNKWGNTSGNMQSAWGSQSPNLTKQQQSQQQSSGSSEWGIPSAISSSTQWGMAPSATPANEGDSQQSSQDSWGQPKRLPNSGTDGWGQAASSSQTNNPSSANAQLSQWGQPTSHSSSSSVWPTAATAANTNTPINQPPASSNSGSITSSSTVSQPQWGANTSAGQTISMSPSSTSAATLSGFTSPAHESTTTHTSWAGAAAKGLPKAAPKPPEPVDPVKQAIEESINNPDGWGRVPVRQDTAWGKPLEKNKQDESNQWHSTQNNGTAIWEASKNSNGQVPPPDKSTWNQKVAGNNDPNVWNGEGSKGKDNALWDDVPNSKDPEPVDQTSTWTSQGAPSRTLSQSSGGDNNTETGWSSNPAAAANGIAVTRSSPNSINQSSAAMNSNDSNWGAQNGNADQRKLGRWESNTAQPAARMNSLPDTDESVGCNSPVVDMLHQSRVLSQGSSQHTTNSAVSAPLQHSQPNISMQMPSGAGNRAGTSYWESAQGRTAGPPNNWSSKPSNSWSNDNSSSSVAGWGQSQSNAISTHGGWGDGPPNNHWQAGVGSNRKPSFGWEDSQGNGGAGDFNRDRNRTVRGESDQGDDADMGDWNESTSVWSSAGGFKQARKHTSIPENHMMPPHMQASNRMGGPHGQYGANNPVAPGLMHGGGNMGGANNNHIASSKQQMISFLVGMNYSKEDAHSALINNNMNIDAAVADLKNNYMQQSQIAGRANDFTRGPIGDNAFNPNIPPPNMPTNALNTPFTNNAQLNQSAVQSSSRINKQNPQRGSSIGRTTQNHNQQVIVKQLEMGVQMNNIHPAILHLPLHDHNVRLIQQLLNLQQTYQQNHDALLQMQRRRGGNTPEAEHCTRVLTSISTQMKSIQAPLIKEAQQQLANKLAGAGGLADNLAGLSMGNNSGAASSSSQTSRLGIWTDKAPGSARQGGVLGDGTNPWSSASSGTSMWSNMSPGAQYLDNQNESHSNPITGAQNQSNMTNSTQSFDIPEFVPGVPWQGATSQKVEDDPNITPGSVARSLSVSTAASLNPSGRSSTDLGWSGNLSSKNAWSAAQNLGSPAGMWSKGQAGGGTRPPPGFGKNMNRSMSMPQGPSEKTSAFSPVGAGWDNQVPSGGGSSSSPWLLIRNLPSQVEGSTLKTLCSQHGPLQSFFVNVNNGQALIRYTTKEEGMKAQKNLNSCNLYDATISAEFVDESDVQRIIDQCQRQGNIGRSHSVSVAPGSAMWPNTTNTGSSPNLWGAGGNMPSGNSSSTTWGAGLSGTFLPTVDGNFAM